MNFRNIVTFNRTPSDKRAFREDGSFFNPFANCAGVADGNSAAYCEDHPPLIYSSGLTGGQMATHSFLINGMCADGISSVEKIIRDANDFLHGVHKGHVNKYHPGMDVGGASFAICKLCKSRLDFIVGGDAFLVIINEKGTHFYHGFDEAAFRVEQEDNMAGYAVCLEQTKTDENPEGNKREAWNLYYPKYTEKRKKYANRLIGQGGYASLNGDPALKDCWNKGRMDLVPGDTLLLGTDGILWADWRFDQIREFIETYQSSGIDGILELRDEKDYLPHIGRGHHPEATFMKIEIEE